MTRTTRPAVRAAALVAAVTVVFAAAPAAVAEQTPAPTPASSQPAVDEPAGPAPGDGDVPAPADPTDPAVPDDEAVPSEPALPAGSGSRFDTFASALLGYYAERSGQATNTFIARNALALSTFTGLDASLLTTASTEQLQGAFTSTLFDGLTDPRSFAAPTLDQAVTLQGAGWAENMLTLTYESLDVPAPSGPSASSMAKESLMFGLLYNTSLGQLVKNQPDLFAQVTAAGVGNPNADRAFKTAMAQAYAASQGDLSRMFPSPCSAAFLSAAASGSGKKAAAAGGSVCSPCVVSGLYAHAQMGQLFTNPSIAAPSAAGLAPTNLTQLPQWQQDIVKSQNPSLTTQLGSAMTGPSTGCSAQSPAIQGTLASALPGVFSGLRQR